MKYYFIMIILFIKNSSALVGYQFQDNLSRERVIPANGEMSITLQKTLRKVSICFSLFVNFNRYSSLVPILDFRNSKDEEPFEVVYGDFKYQILTNNKNLFFRET